MSLLYPDAPDTLQPEQIELDIPKQTDEELQRYALTLGYVLHVGDPADHEKPAELADPTVPSEPVVYTRAMARRRVRAGSLSDAQRILNGRLDLT